MHEYIGGGVVAGKIKAYTKRLLVISVSVMLIFLHASAGSLVASSSASLARRYYRYR
jgi:hypothetical protein